TGRSRVWVQPFPNPTGAKYPIVEGGQPFWSTDGKELAYNSAPAQYSLIPISSRPSFSFGTPVPLPTGIRNTNPTTSPRFADMTRDEKFIGVIDADQTQTGTTFGSQLQVVLN